MEIAESSRKRRYSCVIAFEEYNLVKGEKIEVPNEWAIGALSHPDLMFSFTKEDEPFFKALSEGNIASINRQVEEEITSAKEAIALFIPKPKKGRKPASSTKSTAKAKKE